VPPNAGEARADGELELGESRRRDEERSGDAELAEKASKLADSPADDHADSRSRANAMNASATRERALPEADASDISRVASRP